MVDLSSQFLPGSGFAAVDPVAINDAGEIVGNGTLLTGENHVVVLKPCSSDCGPAAVLSSGSTTAQTSSHPKTETRDEMPKSALDRIRAHMHYNIPRLRPSGQ